MIRFISFLLGKPYESCKSCETLKEQLKFEREEKKQLIETLLNIVKPKEVEAAPVEINPIVQTSGLFSRKRAALEAKARIDAQILKERRHLAVPDDKLKDIDKLETELGIENEGA